MEQNVLSMAEKGVLTLSDVAWKKAHLRNEVIAPLSKQNIIGKEAADGAAQQLGVSRRYIYKLVYRFRRGDGLITDIALGVRLVAKAKAVFRKTLKPLSKIFYKNVFSHGRKDQKLLFGGKSFSLAEIWV